MKLEWMGRYRELVAELVYHSNCINKSIDVKRADLGDVNVTAQEWQILEFILEHEDEHRIMADITSMLAIPQSTVSKMTKHLISCGFVERYMAEGNKKNIILMPTEKAREAYLTRTKTSRKVFQNFFDKLEPLGEEQLALVVEALKTFNHDLTRDNENKPEKYIKL